MNATRTMHPDAGERRGEYNRHLGLALGVSVGLHLALIGLYLGMTRTMKIERPPLVRPDTTSTLVVMGAARPESPRSTEPSRGGPSHHEVERVSRTTAAPRGGNPVAKDDSLVVDGAFASGKDIAYATPWGSDITGKGSDSGGLGHPLPVENGSHGNAAARPLPKPDEFVDAEEQPVWDEADLRRRVKYPEIARRNNIEGVVVVRALIDRDGRVVKTQIDRSDNLILTEAALDAVVATPFTAAKQNGYPVAIWIQIPVTFVLD